MTLTDIQSAIVTGISALPGINHCGFYDQEIADDTAELGNHTGSGQFVVSVSMGDITTTVDDLGAAATPVLLSFSALVIGWKNDADSMNKTREVAEKVAARIRHTRWGLDDLGLAEVANISADEFNPDPEKYRIYEVSFSHHALLSE